MESKQKSRMLTTEDWKLIWELLPGRRQAKPNEDMRDAVAVLAAEVADLRAFVEGDDGAMEVKSGLLKAKVEFQKGNGGVVTWERSQPKSGMGGW